MFRFTIRDVLWLMVVVGMAVGWYAERASRWDVVDAVLLEKEQLFLAAGERGFSFIKTKNGYVMQSGAEWSAEQESKRINQPKIMQP